MLISKADIKSYVQFTLNIEDRMINPNILDAQEYDLKPYIGDDMYMQLLNNFDNVQIDIWDNTAMYNPNVYVIYQYNVYVALNMNSGQQPDINPLDWQLSELGTFYVNYLKPYLVFRAFGRFLLWVGRNITQYGLREMNEETSVPVNEDGRSALISDIKGKASIWQNRFNNFLCDVNWTFDTIKYEIDCDDYKENPRKTFRIRAVDKKRRKPIYRTNNRGGLEYYD